MKLFRPFTTSKKSMKRGSEPSSPVGDSAIGTFARSSASSAGDAQQQERVVAAKVISNKPSICEITPAEDPTPKSAGQRSPFCTTTGCKDSITPRGTVDLCPTRSGPPSPIPKQPSLAEKGKRPMQMVEPACRPHTPTATLSMLEYSPKGSPHTFGRALSPGGSAGASTSRCPSPYTASSRRPSTERGARLTRSSLSSQCSTPASVQSPGSDGSMSKSSSSISVTVEDIMRHLERNSRDQGSPETSALTNLRQLLATMEALQNMHGAGGAGANGLRGAVADRHTLSTLAQVQTLLSSPASSDTAEGNSARVIARAVHQLSSPDPVLRSTGLRRIVSLFGEEYGLLIATVVLLVAQLR